MSPTRRASISRPPSNALYAPLPSHDRDEADGDGDLESASSSYPPSPPQRPWVSSGAKPPLFAALDFSHSSFPRLPHLSSFPALLVAPPPPRTVLFALGSATFFIAVLVLAAAADIPLLGFLRAIGFSNPGRVYDREEDWRILNAATYGLPFLLTRLGYSPIPPSTSPQHIPSILHVVPPPKDIFGYIQWLSITSAHTQLRPSRTLAHMLEGTTPERGENFWWDEVASLSGFQVVDVPEFSTVFDRPVLDPSHKADVIRMRALVEHGGVYVDTDTLVLRDFAELLTGQEEMVMGVEKAHGTPNEPAEVEGLCNAAMVAQKGSAFLERWWQGYRTFGGKGFREEGKSWNYHSVQLPWLLAKNASFSPTPRPITILDHRAFFHPLWDDPGLQLVHSTPSPLFSFSTSRQYAYHMWHHLFKERIKIATEGALTDEKELGPEDAWKRDSEFNFVARRYLAEGVMGRWREWKEARKEKEAGR